MQDPSDYYNNGKKGKKRRTRKKRNRRNSQNRQQQQQQQQPTTQNKKFTDEVKPTGVPVSTHQRQAAKQAISETPEELIEKLRLAGVNVEITSNGIAVANGGNQEGLQRVFMTKKYSILADGVMIPYKEENHVLDVAIRDEITEAELDHMGANICWLKAIGAIKEIGLVEA